MYNLLIKPFVRRMEPGKASKVAMNYFKVVGKIPGGRFLSRLFHGNRPAGMERNVFGLNFYNPVGLSSGLDRKGDLYNDLSGLGFSFVEIGPLDASTTRNAIANLQESPAEDLIAACIVADHLTSFSLAYDFFDFFTIEIKNLGEFEQIMDQILDVRLTYEQYKPVIVKFSNAVTEDADIQRIIDFCMITNIDGIETRTLEQTKTVHEFTKGRLEIIANCVFTTPEEAQELLDSGASLIGMRRGLVSEGPSFVRKVIRHIESNGRKQAEAAKKAAEEAKKAAEEARKAAEEARKAAESKAKPAIAAEEEKEKAAEIKVEAEKKNPETKPENAEESAKQAETEA